jgi:hypothetical protein
MPEAEKHKNLVVFILKRANSICGECGKELPRSTLIRLQDDKGPLAWNAPTWTTWSFSPEAIQQ